MHVEQQYSIATMYIKNCSVVEMTCLQSKWTSTLGGNLKDFKTVLNKINYPLISELMPERESLSKFNTFRTLEAA